MSSAGNAAPRRPRTLVAGLGNVLLKDDGVGIHAVRQLRNLLPRSIVAVEVGTAVLDALHLFEWADRIVAIDAMRAGGAPGTVYSFGIDDVDSDAPAASLHEVSLVSALRLSTLQHRPRITILGVEPESIEYGMDLSPSAAAALPHLLQAAIRMAGESPV